MKLILITELNIKCSLLNTVYYVLQTVVILMNNGKIQRKYSIDNDYFINYKCSAFKISQFHFINTENKDVKSKILERF
jgi:hypothetical protein